MLYRKRKISRYAFLVKIAPSLKFRRDIVFMTKSLHRKWWTHGLFIISIGILFVVVAWSIKTAKQPASVNTTKPAGLTPCDHLMEARKALMDGYKPDEDPIKKGSLNIAKKRM